MSPPDIPIEDLLAHDAWIRALVRRLLRDEHAVDDAVQDTWMRALERRPRVGGRFRFWLRRVARNAALVRRRDEARRDRRERACAREEGMPSTSEVVERHERRTLLSRAVLELDEPYRSTILYRFFENRRPREIAAELEIPVATVNTRIHRGLEFLRARLDRDFGGDRHGWSEALLPLLRTFSLRTSAAGGAASASALTGALVMSVKMKIGIAAIVLLGVAAIFWSQGSEPVLPETETAKGTAGGKEQPPAAAGAPSSARAERVTPAFEPATTSPSPPAAAAAVVRDGFITGTVRNEGGEPLPGATVRAFGFSKTGESRATEERELLRTETDANGVYALGPIRTWSYHEVIEASAKDHYTERREAQLGTVQHFVLGRGGMLSGSVRVAGSDSPCPGALVKAVRTTAHSAFRTPMGQRVTTTGIPTRTDARGEYHFTGLRPGTYRLSVFPRLNPGRDPAPPWVEVRAGGEAVQDLMVSSGYPLHGTVTAKDTGEPIEGAVIRVGDNPAQRVRTDKNGRFELPGLPYNDSAFLMVSADGFADAHQQVYFRALQGKAEKSFALERAVSLGGRVIGPDDHGIAGAQVSGGGKGATTDEDGRFLVTGIPASRKPGALWVMAEGIARTSAKIEDHRVGADENEVLIRLSPRGGTVWGHVKDPEGKPVQEARVSLRIPRRPGYVCSTDEHGRFERQNVVPGVYRLEVITKGALEDRCSRFRRVRREEIRIDDGGRTQVDVTLRLGSTITGRVVDGFGQPLEGASVHARPSPEWRRTGQATFRDVRRTLTRPDGTFLLEGLLEGDGTFVLSARKVGYQAATLPDPLGGRRGYMEFETDAALVDGVKPGAQGVVIALKKIPRIQGRVTVAATGKPAAEFWIRAERSSPEKPSGRKSYQDYFTDSDGRFLLPVREGTFAVTARTPAGESSPPVTVLAVSGSTAPAVQLVVHRGASVCGMVVTPNGGPAAESTVVLLALEGEDRGAWKGGATTDDKGSFAIRHVSPGAYLARATQIGFPEREAVERIVLAAGAETEVRLALAVGGRFQAWVHDPSGRVIQGAKVTVKREDGTLVKLDRWRYFAELKKRFKKEGFEVNYTFWPPFTTTNPAGLTRHRHLAAGRYVAHVAAPGYQAVEKGFTVATGLDTRLEITLTK